MAIRNAPTFSAGNIAAPNLSVSMSGLNTVSDMMVDEENRRRQLVLDNELRLDKLRQQANADRVFDLQKANADRQAQQDEYDMQIKSAEMGIGADRDTATAAHRAQVLKNQAERDKLTAAQNIWAKKNASKRLSIAEQTMLNAETERQRKREMEEGMIAGQGIVPVNQVVDGTEDVINQPAVDTFTGNVGDAIRGTENIPELPQSTKVAEYKDYLKANDPEAHTKYTTYKSALDRTGDLAKDNLSRIPGNLISGVKSVIDPIFDTRSQADKDLITAVPKKKGVMSFAEFSKSRYEAPSVNDQLKLASTAIKDMSADELKSQGLTKTQAGVRPTTKAEQIADVNAKIAIMQQNNPGMSKAQVLGMKQAAYATIEKEEAKKYENAKVQASMMIDNFKLDRKHEKAKELAKYKADLDSKDPNKKRKAIMEIAKLSAQTKAIEKKLYESDTNILGF